MAEEDHLGVEGEAVERRPREDFDRGRASEDLQPALRVAYLLRDAQPNQLPEGRTRHDPRKLAANVAGGPDQVAGAEHHLAVAPVDPMAGGLQGTQIVRKIRVGKGDNLSRGSQHPLPHRRALTGMSLEPERGDPPPEPVADAGRLIAAAIVDNNDAVV